MSAAFIIPHANRKSHIVLCGLPGSTNFSHISYKQHSFRKKIIEHKMRFFIFSTTSVRYISHSKKNSAKYYGIYIYMIPCKLPVILSDLMKLEFSRQSLETSSNIKFHENPSTGSWVFPCGRTDRHDEASSPFFFFCNFAKSPEKVLYVNRNWLDSRAH